MTALSILTIDSGNSFVKWGFYAGDVWVKKDKVHNSQLESLNDVFLNLPEPNMIVISHVSDEAIRDQLTFLTSCWPVKPDWVLAQSFQCGVTNAYSRPSQLGSDRWAALIAARKFQKENCLVVNVGTAMTVDALSASGHFLGGLILPGFHAMMDGLKAKTQLMSVAKGDYQDFPINTDDAIYSGVIQSLLGAIERMYSSFSQQNHPVGNCILSGGGAYQLMPFIKLPIVHIENLVLEGLVMIANDLAQKRIF
ncbi:type III pantothenate kinase [Nitrosomonas sp. JL21]|uniref:type III pantothenate kinase n=1 Tax=Nitrosomonas sp. JL21 TaxID=153949 RepID=UPI001369B775|nr:type III pantothenate kinase [Nitrosomonas sp. JL21]MBL8498273.1 type III pantothenate kinase [Nitrosomonas sp.]MCC7091873.1 type III pantothenate kinase [Nitrosomonas sp.]MXS77695.1 type III pantothenate kinase [Nitrosomonas sp. JL21]